MRKSGLTSATLQDLRRRAQQTAGFEVEIDMEMEGKPQEFSDVSPQKEDIAPDLPGEPWDHDWEVTEPLLDRPEDNTQRNLERPMTEFQQDVQMAREVIAETLNVKNVDSTS